MLSQVSRKIHNDPLFLPERLKFEECQKLVCATYDKKSCVVHSNALKIALDYALILERLIVQLNSIKKHDLTLFRMGFFGAAHGWWGRGTK